MGSVNAGKPIVMNGGSPYTRDLQGLAATITGIKEPASRSRLARALAAPFRGVMGKMGHRKEGGK